MLERDKARAGTATRWPSPDVSLVAYVEEKRGKILQVYQIQPELIREHFGTEQSVLSSGYRYRQIFEVVQNAADAILEAAEAGLVGGILSDQFHLPFTGLAQLSVASHRVPVKMAITIVAAAVTRSCR
jgi:hypothetical protein